MTIYLLNFGSIFLYWLLIHELNKIEQNHKKMICFFMTIACIQMVLILGFKGISVGNDAYSYRSRFNRYSMMTINEIFNNDFQEVGFSLLIKAIAYFTDNYQCLVFISAVLSVVPVIITITKCSKKPFLSVLLFIAFDYYAFVFSGMRQGIAYGLCFFSYLFIKEKKPIKFLIVVILAAQFHKSAYLFLPAYFIAQPKINKKTIILMIVAFVFVVVFKENMFNYMKETMYDNYEITNTNPFGIFILIITITVVSILFKDNAIKIDKSFNCSLMLLCTGAVLLPFISIGTNAKRIVEYYCIFMILIIPGMLDGIADVKISKLANIGVVICLSMLYSIYLLADVYNIVPYLPFWSY